MNATLEKALIAAQEGDPAALESFGLERHTLKGAGIPGAGTEWEERMTLTGDGVLTLRSNRSIADIGLEPIGEYRTRGGRDLLHRAIDLLREARLDELPPFRIEPADARIRINLAAGGVVQRTFIGLSDPAALVPVKPLLQELDRMAETARANPVRTLRIEVEAPLSMRAATVRAPVTLRFQNRGEQGYWITHPGALDRRQRWECCNLVYGRRPEAVPGFTPPSIERYDAPLEPARNESLDLLWIPAGAAVEYRFTATLEAPAQGTYLARAVFSTYAGEDSVSGRPRLRGCVFSNQLTIEVR